MKYSEIYSVPVILKGGSYTGSVQFALPFTPYLLNKNIKGINFTTSVNVATGLRYYFTFKNINNETLIFNLPMKDIVTASELGGTFNYISYQLRNFNLNKIDLSKSYVIYSGAGLVVAAAGVSIGNLNFYLA